MRPHTEQSHKHQRQVIEQEAGIEEYDSRDRPFIWSMTGGEIRYASGLVDALVGDGINAVKSAMNQAIAKGVPAQHRSDKYEDFLTRLTRFDTRQQAEEAKGEGHLYLRVEPRDSADDLELLYALAGSLLQHSGINPLTLLVQVPKLDGSTEEKSAVEVMNRARAWIDAIEEPHA